MLHGNAAEIGGCWNGADQHADLRAAPGADLASDVEYRLHVDEAALPSAAPTRWHLTERVIGDKPHHAVIAGVAAATSIIAACERRQPQFGSQPLAVFAAVDGRHRQGRTRADFGYPVAAGLISNFRCASEARP